MVRILNALVTADRRKIVELDSHSLAFECERRVKLRWRNKVCLDINANTVVILPMKLVSDSLLNVDLRERCFEHLFLKLTRESEPQIPRIPFQELILHNFLSFRTLLLFQKITMVKLIRIQILIKELDALSDEDFHTYWRDSIQTYDWMLRSWRTTLSSTPIPC
jgi:hypothetical protein